MKFQNARINFRITLYHALIPSKYLERVKFPTRRCTTRLLRQFVGVLSLALKDTPRDSFSSTYAKKGSSLSHLSPNLFTATLNAKFFEIR